MTEPTAREMIPALLDKVRPDRYDPTDHTWQAKVVSRVAAEISEFEARKLAADKLVTAVEARATRRTNALLRDVFRSGQFPLDWWDAMAWPLAVSDAERVALRAATTEDLRRFAQRERRSASQEFTARSDACEGAEFLANLMVKQKVKVASKLTILAAAVGE